MVSDIQASVIEELIEEYPGCVSLSMFGGQKVKINPLGFQNDLTSMDTREKVLTLLVHLGYLAYDSEKNSVHIPNLEVADAFKLAVEETGWESVGEALKKAADLLDQTTAYYNREVHQAVSNIN